MISKSFEFQCDFDFQITISKMIWILNHLYLGDLILILKSSTYDDFAHLWQHDSCDSTNSQQKNVSCNFHICCMLQVTSCLSSRIISIILGNNVDATCYRNFVSLECLLQSYLTCSKLRGFNFSCNILHAI